MRIASNSVISGSTALQAAGAKTSGVSFLVTLASASYEAVRGAGAVSSRSQARSSANSTGRTPSKDEKSPASAANTDLNSGAVQAPAPLEKCLSANTSEGQQKEDSPTNTTSVAPTETTDGQVSPAKFALLQQTIAPLWQDASAPEDTALQQALQSAALPPENTATGNDQTAPSAVPAVTSENESAFAIAELGSAGSLALPADLVRNNNLASTAVLRNSADANQHSIESIANKTPGSVKSDSANKADTEKNSIVTSTPIQSNGTQSDGQPAQHSQADASKTVAVEAKLSDSAAFPTNAFPAHVALQESVASHSITNSNDDLPRRSDVAESLPSDQLNSNEAAGTSGISTARLIQTMSETEMRVGMRSSEFGDISIRTSVSQQQMVAQISTDHGDLGAAISAHIPSVQEKLGSDFGLHASIQVSQGGASFSDEWGNSSQKQQQTAVRSVAFESAAAAAAEADKSTLRSPPIASDEYRLDIRA